MRLGIGIGIILIAASCGGAQRDADTLGDTVRAFNEAVRWERFEKAAILLPARERAQAVDDWDERAHDVKITDWELVKIDPKNPNEARAQVKLSWYKLSEQVLRETQAVQTWEKHGHDWTLVDEARVRGAEMPGLPETASKRPEHVALPKPQPTR